MTVMRRIILGMTTRMMARYDQSSATMKSMISLVLRYAPGQMTCEEFGEFIGAYHDGEMSPALLRKFEFHLAACPKCDALLKDYSAAVVLARASGDAVPEPPLDLKHAILSAVRDHRPPA